MAVKKHIPHLRGAAPALAKAGVGGFQQNQKHQAPTLVTWPINDTAQPAAKHSATRNSLPGVGDLVLTCSSNLSRNYSVGHAMASNAVPEHKSLGHKGEDWVV
jgi:glycerol-3-phosphate dehydrogenase